MKKHHEKEVKHPMLHGHHESMEKEYGKKSSMKHSKKSHAKADGVMNADHHHKAMMHHMKALHKMAKKGLTEPLAKHDRKA